MIDRSTKGVALAGSSSRRTLTRAAFRAGVRVRFLAIATCGALVLAGPACKSDASDAGAAATDGGVVEGACVIPAGSTTTEFLTTIACTADFQALASTPLDATIPGARSVKVILDQADQGLTFQNSVLYPIHYDFASTHLSGNGKPIVPPLAQFNTTEYYTPDRRFILGAVTYYEGPKIWALEISPYDSASAEMITALFRKVSAASFFGPLLKFHPTSEAVAAEAKKLAADIPIVTTDEIYAGIDYQPLSIAAGIGRVHFVNVASLATEYLAHEDLVVIDQVPNDISVVQGIISQEFQTPLSHVNILSQNRKTPNMALRGAMTNPTLRALEGKLAELTVTAADWKVREVTQEEADAYWAAHKPAAVVLPAMDLGVTGLRAIGDVSPEPVAPATLRDTLRSAVLAFGGKAAHYSVLTRTTGVPIQDGFAVPVFYYDAFMKQNGFYDRVDQLLADASFQSDYRVRDTKLAELRAAMLTAPLDASFETLLQQKLAEAPYAGHKVRFRTSTNSEDLEGFPCAGCYESHTGDPSNWEDIRSAIRETYATVWLFRTFEERAYYSVDHKSVGMALLVHRNFPDEEANGVAVTANPFDPTGVNPAFYVNVQVGGDVEVVAPPAGVKSDQFLYFFGDPGQPVTYLAHSSLLPAGQAVLTAAQRYELGTALQAIHQRFSPAYGPAAGNTGWYAMDVEFKFDNDENPAEAPHLYVKQARPYPGRGSQ